MNTNSMFGTSVSLPAYHRPDDNISVRFMHAIGSASQLYQVVFEILQGFVSEPQVRIRNLAVSTYGMLLTDALEYYDPFKPTSPTVGQLPEFVLDYELICGEMLNFYRNNNTLTATINFAREHGLRLIPEYPPMDFTSTVSFNLSLQKRLP